MYHTIITVVSIFSVFVLKNTGCALVYSCNKFDASLWTHGNMVADQTNGLCENYCKDADVNYAYSGTIHRECYCRETDPLAFDKIDDDGCIYKCPGNNTDICGGLVKYYRITVSKIDYAVGKSCYEKNALWTYIIHHEQLTNRLCESYCKNQAANFAYSGTVHKECYCRETDPLAFDKIDDDGCIYKCPGNNRYICGGHVNSFRITVSKIDRTTHTVTGKNTETTSVTSVSTRVSTITEFMNMITSDTSSAIATPYTTHDLSSTTTQKANLASVMTETSTQATTGLSTEIVAVKNTEATSTMSLSIKESKTTDVMRMITVDTSPSIVMQITPPITHELLSTTSEIVDTFLSTSMTETSTKTTTEQTTEALTTAALTVQNTKATNASVTFISIRDTTTADINNKLTSEISPAIVTQSTLDTMDEISSSTSENVNSAISTVMTETSTPAITDQTTEAVTVQNTQTTSATSFSIRDTTTADINNKLTSEISPAIVTQSTPDTIDEISSSTSENVNSAISTVMTETSTPARTVKRPKKLLCECPKIVCNTKWHFLDGSDITDSEVMKLVLEDFYQNILSEITIDKKSVTKEVRKRNSAINKTKSAKFIGWGCIVFLILPMATVVAIDLLNCCFHFQKRSRRSKYGKRNRIKAISGDTDIPLEEIVSSAEDYYASRCGNNFHPDEIKRETYHKRRVDPC